MPSSGPFGWVNRGGQAGGGGCRLAEGGKVKETPRSGHLGGFDSPESEEAAAASLLAADCDGGASCPWRRRPGDAARQDTARQAVSSEGRQYAWPLVSSNCWVFMKSEWIELNTRPGRRGPRGGSGRGRRGEELVLQRRDSGAYWMASCVDSSWRQKV